jgi:hypothetical protein
MCRHLPLTLPVHFVLGERDVVEPELDSGDVGRLEEVHVRGPLCPVSSP